RDGRRQTAVDLMQLVRVIEVGIDVDGDTVPDLDASRIYYVGHSLGGMYGTLLLAVEPSVHAGVLNGDGGPNIDVRRLSPVNRPALGANLAAWVPSLINIGGVQWLCTKSPVRNLTRRSIRTFWSHFDGFLRSKRSTLPLKSIAKEHFLCKAGYSSTRTCHFA